MLAPWLEQLDLFQAVVFFTTLNVLLVAGSAGLWNLTRRIFSGQLLFSPARPFTASDIWLVAGCIAMNVVISIVGWRMWQLGLLTLSKPSIIGSVLTWIAMLVVMDFGMYVTHRIAHVPWIYHWLHRQHHEHVETNSLSLFVLNPVEVLGFGGLLLLAILIVRPTELGLSLYLTTNLIVGTLGHTGVEFISWHSVPDRPGRT